MSSVAMSSSRILLCHALLLLPYNNLNLALLLMPYGLSLALLLMLMEEDWFWLLFQKKGLILMFLYFHFLARFAIPRITCFVACFNYIFFHIFLALYFLATWFIFFHSLLPPLLAFSFLFANTSILF